MLEMREREGSDVLGAREDRGNWGREASKHSSEVGFPQERDKEVSQYSAEADASRDKDVSRPSAEDRTAEFRCMREDARAAERERWDTRGLTANNDWWCRRLRRTTPWWSPADEKNRQNSFQRKTVVNRRFTRSAQSRFTKRAGRVLTSTASRRRLERCMRHSAEVRLHSEGCRETFGGMLKPCDRRRILTHETVKDVTLQEATESTKDPEKCRGTR